MGKILISLILVNSLFATIAFGDQILNSEEITNWGDWGDFERCPPGEFVQGIQIKSETWIGPFFDDSSMNGLRFYCGEPALELSMTSSVGSWGQWRNKYTCGDGYVVGFQLRVEKGSVINYDETATNNIRIFCSNHNPGNYLEADGEVWGNWSEESRCAENEAVCGLQTQVQPDRGVLLDDTALNNIAVHCCDLPSK